MSFSKNFLWGAASAAAQVEGGWNEDGRAPSIWDEAPAEKVAHGETCHTACDVYHRFREDVALMKKIGLTSYRFSVSWSRVFTGPETLNPAGLDFYSDLVDELLKAGITPLVTLFHWDLPVWAHRMGGWLSPSVREAFALYAATLAQRLGDRVTYWMTFNEPSVFVNCGYRQATHPPYCRDDEATVCRISRGVLIAHGLAVRAIRAHSPKEPKISMALTGVCFTPLSLTEAGREEARRRTFCGAVNSFSWWGDPAFLGTAPAPLCGFISEEDWKIIHQPLDYFGVNIYFSINYRDEPGGNPRLYPGVPRTTKKWPITPEVLYWAPVMLWERYGLPVMVTENGMANTDFVMLDGKVHDPQRSDFVTRYLGCLKLAAEDGVPVLGYNYWSLHDNFEWSDGYDPRFGLIYVDYRTGGRTLKESTKTYAEIIRTNGKDLPDMRADLV